jgi:HK97 family phage major capsid protein
MRAVARGDMTLKILTDSKNGGQPIALSLTKKLDTRKESRKMDAIDIPFVMPNEQREFSVGRAIRAEVSGDWSQAGFEREMCQEAKRNYAGTAKGLVIPESAIYQQRAVMTSTGDVSGAIGTQLLGGRYVDIPRQKSSVMEAGATTLTGLQSNVAIPKLSSDTSATFVAENSAISDDDLDVDQISMLPRLCAGTASFTRTVLETSNPRIDTLVRTGLELQIMNRIDSSALTGDGSGANPTGITATSGINTKATTGSSTMTHAEALEVIAAVAANNIDTAGGAWIVHPNDAAVIGATSKDSGSGTFVYENGSIGGKRVIESTHAPEGTAFFGVFEHLYIGFFGGLDLVIDPYSSARNGVIEITASQLVDVAVAHNKAFNKVTLTA